MNKEIEKKKQKHKQFVLDCLTAGGESSRFKCMPCPILAACNQAITRLFA